MKIDDREVPAAVLSHWKEALQAATLAALAELARAHPSLQAGFRPGKVPQGPLRLRAKALLDTASGLPEAVRGVLAQQGLQSALLSVLSEEAISAQAGAWADAFGRVAVFSAMLLDDRPSVRALGFSQLEHWNGQAADEATATRARAVLAEAFGPFLRTVAPLFGRADPAMSGADVAGVARAAATGAVEATASTLSADVTHPDNPSAPDDSPVAAARLPRSAGERALVLQLRAQRLETRRAQRACREAERERDRLTLRADAADVQLSEARVASSQLSQELRRVQARIEALVLEGVQAQLDERLRPWLAPAEQLQQGVQALAGSPLLDEVQALLRRQSEVDRREGLRSTLVAELQRTRGLLAEVQRARVDALNPLSHWPDVAQRLQAHAAALQARLDQAVRGVQPTALAPAAQHLPLAAATDDATATPLSRLQQMIAAAPTLDALATLRQHLHSAERLALLTPEQTAAAHALLHEAVSRLYDRTVLAAGLAQAPLPDARAFPLQALQAALARRLPRTLVVDGHNVLHLLPALFRPYHDAQGQPTGRARQALAERLQALAGRHPTLHVELWFDGPAHDTRSLSEQVRVHFSGGSGSDRADGAIVAQLRHLCDSKAVTDPNRQDAKSPGAEGSVRQVTVVSADTEVRDQVLALGAAVMLPAELAWWF
ncbi:MAG: hypothetical protein ACO3YN_00285 [Rubrivivax sp.]